MNIFAERVSNKKPGTPWVESEDKELVRLRDERCTIAEIGSCLLRSESSVKYRIRFLKYVKKQYGSLVHYRSRNKIHVSPVKWDEKADREFIKKMNGVYRADRRGRQRRRIICKAENLLIAGQSGRHCTHGIDDVMNLIHRKMVSKALFTRLLCSYQELAKKNDELKELKDRLVRLAA